MCMCVCLRPHTYTHGVNLVIAVAALSRRAPVWVAREHLCRRRRRLSASARVGSPGNRTKYSASPVQSDVFVPELYVARTSMPTHVMLGVFLCGDRVPRRVSVAGEIHQLENRGAFRPNQLTLSPRSPPPRLIDPPPPETTQQPPSTGHKQDEPL